MRKHDWRSKPQPIHDMDKDTPKKSHPTVTGNTEESIIFTRARHDPFSRMPKDALDVPTLSFKAKGIMAYLLGKPPGWIIRMDDLQKHGREGRDAIREGMKDLAAHGYALHLWQRDDLGRMVSSWRISDAPIFPSLSVAGFPSPDNPLLSKNEFSKNAPGRIPGTPRAKRKRSKSAKLRQQQQWEDHHECQGAHCHKCAMDAAKAS